MKQSSYPRRSCSSSFHQDSSPGLLPSNNEGTPSRRVDNIDTYISRFDERISKLENISRSFHDDRSSAGQKKTTEPSSSEVAYKGKGLDDSYSLLKAEGSRKVQYTDTSSADLNRRSTLGGTRPVEVRQDENGRVNERISGIERRMDIIERRVDQLATSFQSFMHRMEGRSQGADRVPERIPDRVAERIPERIPDRVPERVSERVPERHNTWQERATEENDLLPEVKLLGNGIDRRPERGQKPPANESPYTQKRPASRDTGNARENLRDIVNTKEDGNLRDRVREALEQVARRREEGRNTVDNVRERSEGKSLEVKVPGREIKGNLKSPDTERKRKNVSWSEIQTPDQESALENEYKRKRLDMSGDIENLKMLMSDDYIKGKDRPNTANRSQRKFEERLSAVEIPNQRESIGRRGGDTTYERFVADRTEARNNERMSSSNAENESPVVKDKLLEERRKKIDEEIERRINKQIEVKKRAEVAVEGQKRVYEKNSVVEDDFKISPYSTEKSRDKEVVSRLVREKQMRNELISKYSETGGDSSKKS